VIDPNHRNQIDPVFERDRQTAGTAHDHVVLVDNQRLRPAKLSDRPP